VPSAHRRPGPHDRVELLLGPGILAVAEVLALEAVEVPVAVGVRLVVRRQTLLRDHRAQDLVVAEAGLVGAAVADQMDRAVLGDHAVAQRAGQLLVAVPAELDGVPAAPGHGLVDHHAVDRVPGALCEPIRTIGAARATAGEIPLSAQ
jgi:hypothetical protein